MSAEIARECTTNFIRHSINPVIAVLASYEAEMVCQKNSLSFCELLAPFNKLSSDAAFKDPSNQSHLVKSLSLDFRDLRREGFLTTNALPLALTELVRSVPFATEVSHETDDHCPEVTPWYEQYRKQFTKLLEPCDHEFVRNYIACILVVSTSHSDPLDQLTRLSQTQHVFQHQLGSSTGRGSELLHLPKHAANPKWFSPNIFKFHVLLHDVSCDDEKKAETVYQSMKMTYGAHACHLLRINSNNSSSDDANSPDPWVGYLKNNLRHFDSVRLDYTRKQSYTEDPVLISESSTINHSSSLVDLTTSNVDGPIGNSDIIEIQRPKVVRSESIPHPLSSADLTNLANETSAQYQSSENIYPTDIKHGVHLSSTDIDRIKIFVQELCLRGLLPFVERQLKLLNDQISSRRGLISKSLVSSAKRWFTSGSSPNLPSVAANAAQSPDKSPATSFRPQHPPVTYAPESVEMQMRRLADLAFLFQHYDLAYQHYYALKKEFAHTGAWLHQASAAEFASLCVYLSGPSTATPYPSHYMDMALTTYSSMCEKPWLAVRATIFGAEILISHCNQTSYSEAAGLYIRMTTGDDLSGALFLERAAWCFAKAKLYRKAALHLILAGHRYRKSGLNNHTYRCYELAYVSYQFRGWSFADDHIKFTLSNHCRNLVEQNNCPENYDLTETFLKLRHYCFSNDYLSNTKQSTNLVASAVSKKPLPLGLNVRDGYNYGYKHAAAVSVHSLTEDAFRARNINKPSLSPDVFSSRLSCPSTLTHDFYKSSLCYVPVQLTLFNHHTACNLKVVIKMYTGSQSFSDFTSKGQVCQPITWTNTSLRVTRLKPNESKMINLLGYTAYPGVYDVGNLWLKFSQDDLNDEFETKIQSHFVTLRQMETR